jgi:ribosomal protein S8
MYRRHRRNWSVTEVLQLQREYELLEWSIQQIAKKHERSVDAILYKLEQEGFISSWSDARGYTLPPEVSIEVEKQNIQKIVSDRLSTLRSRNKVVANSPTSSTISRRSLLHF